MPDATRKARIRKSKDPKRAKKPWIADYFDQDGKRHQKGFKHRGAANDYLVKVLPEVRDGTHTPESGSITVAEACNLFLERCEQRLTRGAMRNYRNYASRIVSPPLGNEKLARLTLPRVERYCDELLNATSPQRAKKWLWSWLPYSMRRNGGGWSHVARGVKIVINDRDKGRIGIDVPSREEIQKLLHHASPHLRPLLVTAVFTGMRSGELRAGKISISSAALL